MRILTINYEYPPLGGGGGTFTRDVLEEISKKGHEITVLTTHHKSLLKKETVNGVKIIRVPVFFRTKLEVANILSMLSYFPSSLLKALFSLRRREIDIINTHFAVPSGPTGFVLSKLWGIPNVLTLHGGDIYDPCKKLSPHKNFPLLKTVQYVLRTADLVVAQSSDTKNNAYQYYKVNRSIDTIPLGIKKPDFSRKSRTDFNLEPGMPVFCTIGRLIKRKNIDDVLQVLSQLKNQHSFQFLIIGEGPERSHLEALTQQLGLNNNVRFYGNVTDEVKFQLLDLSDYYLSTALHEGFGLVFLEAMSLGLPVICYNRGGQTDFLVNEKSGFLIEVGDRKSFHQKITYLIQNDETRRRMSEHNKETVKDYYIEACAEQYLNLFKKALEKKPVTAPI